MIELENFNCKIFTDYVEPGAMETIYEVCRNKAFEGKQVRVMPDIHSGEVIVIGFTAPLGDWVNPDHVGCDLGCSISALFMSEPIPPDKYPLFEHRLKKTFPLGKRLQEQRMFEVKDFLKFLR
jgi:RNA-splicing ligase RtcB